MLLDKLATLYQCLPCAASPVAGKNMAAAACPAKQADQSAGFYISFTHS
jgi:hypothetical protein